MTPEEDGQVGKVIDAMTSMHATTVEAQTLALEATNHQQILVRALDRAVDGLLATECSCGAVDDDGESQDCARCIALKDVRTLLGEHWDIGSEDHG